MTQETLPTILVVMALPMESRNEIERIISEKNDGLSNKAHWELLYTGVGKVNAASTLALRLGLAQGKKESIQSVINLGTAGSHHFSAHELVNVTAFRQHDMDVSPLGFAKGETPFEANGAELTNLLEWPQTESCKINKGIGHTGDAFITESHHHFAVIDMEGYALTKVCQHAGVPIVALKYITDGADHQAADDWDKKLEAAAKALANALQSLDVKHLIKT